MELPKLPWLGDWYLPLKDYYVDLTMTLKGEKGLKKSITKLQDIFQPCGRVTPTRILIEGPAGYGKSTLALKLCHDFGMMEDNYMSRFDIVILIRLREFEGPLEEMIVKNINLKNTSSSSILKALHQNQSRVLIILDGWDELNQRNYQFLVPLVKNEIYPQATVIVTSRLGSVQIEENAKPILGNILDCYDTRIKIKGVIGNNKIQFLQCYLKGCPKQKIGSVKLLLESKFGISLDKGTFFSRITKKLKGIFGSLSGDDTLFDCPLFLLLLVTLAMETDIESIETKTELYKALFNFVVRRSHSKVKKTLQPVDLFEFNKDNSPSDVHNLYQLGKVALQAVRKKEYVLSRQLLCEHCDDVEAVLAYGFLTQNDCIEGVHQIEWYEPVHLSLLEFMAAYHLCLSLISNPNSSIIAELVVNNRQFLESTSTEKSLLFPFLAGLLGKELHRLHSLLSILPLSVIDEEYQNFIQITLPEISVENEEFTNTAVTLVPNDISFVDVDLKEKDSVLAIVARALDMRKVGSVHNDRSRPFLLPLKESLRVDKISFDSKCLKNESWLKIYKGAQCRELVFDLTNNFNHFKAMGEVICKNISYQQIHLKFSLRGSSQLQWLLEMASNGFLKGRLIFVSLELTSLKTNEKPFFRINELIQSDLVVGMNIAYKIQEKKWREWVMKDFLSCVSQSKQLQELCIDGIFHDLDIEFLFNNGKRKWRLLRINNRYKSSVKGTSYAIEVERFLTYSGSFQAWNCLHSSSVSVGIDDGFFESLHDLSHLSSSLHELSISASGCFKANLFLNLIHLKNLQRISLECSWDIDYSSAVLDQFVLVLSSFQLLQRLDLIGLRDDSVDFISALFGSIHASLKSTEPTQQQTKLSNDEIHTLPGRIVEITSSYLSRTSFQSLESIQLDVCKSFVDYLESLDNDKLQLLFSDLKWLLQSHNVDQVSLQMSQDWWDTETLQKFLMLSYDIFPPEEGFIIQREGRVPSDTYCDWYSEGFSRNLQYTLFVHSQ